MKQLIINLKSLLKRGLLRIFPKAEALNPWNPETFIPLVLGLTVLTVVSCSTPRYVTQMVTDIKRDTIYVSNFQYDSVYVFKDKITDRSRDTLYIREVQTEYKCRVLRDTILKVQHDSIPYEVVRIETKEITRPLTLYDRICRTCFWFLIGALAFWLYRKLKSLTFHL